MTADPQGLSRLECVGQLAGLPRLDLDAVASAVHVHVPRCTAPHLLLVVGLGGLVAEEGVVDDLPLVVEHELHGLASLYRDRRRCVGDVAHLDVDGAGDAAGTVVGWGVVRPASAATRDHHRGHASENDVTNSHAYFL